MNSRMEKKNKTNTSLGKERMLSVLNANKGFFWDKGPLDLEQDSYIIIERMLEFGSEEDINVLIGHYGIEPLKRVIKESRSLSPKTVNYFAWLFGIPRKDTKCFSDASPKIWNPF